MDRQRLDKWLWHARIVKTRTSAAGLIRDGRVRVNSRPTDAPGHAIRVGDVVTVALDSRVCVWRIEGFADHRGGAEAARALYTDLERN